MSARILVVDDVPANLMALAAVLRPLDREVVLASSGAEALRAALDGEFALILMDVAMPGLDGVQTATLLRERERSRTIPIIFVTAHPSEFEYTRRAYASGGVDYIVKPFDPDILRSKVSVFVQLYEQAEGLRRQAEALAIESSRRAAAEEVNYTKDVFISILGHDLRSPLNAIRMAAELLQRSPQPPEKQQQLYERIIRGTRRMDALIEDVLDFARGRVGQGIQVTRTPTSFEAIARPVVDDLRISHPGREITFEAVGDLQGQWDPGRVAQVVTNLVGNALQHCKVDPVRVVIDGTAPVVRFEVSNPGAIDASALERLFEPFRRGEGVSQGLGLGLYIVREIARAHGGHVRVAVDPERDRTSFIVELPR